MKQKLTFIILLLFIAQFCFSAVFHDVSLDEFVYGDDAELFDEIQEELDEEEAETLEEIMEDIAESYSTYHPVAKAFFQSVPVDLEVTPVVYDVGWEDYQYSLDIRKDSLQILLYDFFADEEGLHGYAEVFVNITADEYWEEDIEKSYATFTFPEFCIKNDGKIECGPSDDEFDGLLCLEDGTEYEMREACLEENGDSYSISGALVYTAGYKYGFSSVKLFDAVIDTECNFLSMEVTNEPQSVPLDKNGYEFEFTSIKTDGDDISACGVMKAPGLNLSAEFNNYEIKFSPKEYTASCEDSEFTFNYLGYTLYGTNLCMNTDFLKIYDASILYDGQKLPLGEVWFNYNYGSSESKAWIVLDENACNVEGNIHLFRDDDLIKRCVFDSKGLKLVVASKFPKGNNYTDTYDCIAKPDGSISLVENYYSKRKLGLGDAVMDCELVSFSEDCKRCYVYAADILFPENCCYTGLKLEKFHINSDGTFEDVRLQSFSKICGMSFIPNSKTIVDDGIILSGTVFLPERMPGSFSGTRVTVEKMYVGFDGTLKEFVATTSGRRTSFISDFFSFGCKDSHIEIEQTRNDNGGLNPAKAYICLDDGYVYFPTATYSVDGGSELYAKNARLNLDGKEPLILEDWDFNTDFEFGVSGMKLDVESVSFIPARGSGSNYSRGYDNNLKGYFLFTGMLTLPAWESMPAFLRGIKLPAVIGVDLNTCICKSEVTLDVAGGNLKTSYDDKSALAISSLKAHFEPSVFNERYLALVADSCTYVLTDVFPEWLSGTEIPGNLFVYDFHEAHYLVLSGTKTGFDTANFVPAMEDASITIDYSYSEPQNGSITVSGSIVSPEPVSFGNEPFESGNTTGTLLFDMSGKQIDFTVKYD